MKKNAKRIAAVYMLRWAINDFMRRHPMYKFENYTQCDNCCVECDSCVVAQFMISLYGANHELIARNWLCNSRDNSDYCNSSSLINQLEEYYNINVAHLMHGRADELLHKVRYIRIGERGINREGDILTNMETGREYRVFPSSSLVSKRYVSTWEVDTSRMRKKSHRR